MIRGKPFKKGIIPWNKGQKLSKEICEKMSKADKGRKGYWTGKKRPEMNGENNPSKSLDVRKKISIAKKGKPNWYQLKNVLHPSWIDGRSKNKEYVSWSRNKRNRIKKILNNNGHYHTFGEWQTLKAQYNWTCPCCKKSEPEIKLTEDHIIPLSKGGSDIIENIQPLCVHCNFKKHTKIFKYEL